MILAETANIVAVDEQALLTTANTAFSFDIRLLEKAATVGQHNLCLGAVVLETDLGYPIDALNVDPVCRETWHN